MSEHAPRAENYSVAVCFVTRRYGGPEEGGWWWDDYQPDPDFARFVRGFRTQAAAGAYQNRLDRHLIPALNRGRRSLGSVLSTGVYDSNIYEGLPTALRGAPTYE